MNLEFEETDVWDALAADKKPVAVYGMGNAAEKIIAVLNEKGIEISEIFASDEFVRGHSFLGHKVLKYSEVCEKYDDFNVVLSFASHLDGVIDNIIRINGEHRVYAPDIPVAGNGLFTGKYFKEHKNEFRYVYDRLADDESKRVYENIIKFKISGKIEYLLDSLEKDKSRIYADILNLGEHERIVDAGAYDGDTIREFTSFTNGKYDFITALEPDGKNFKKLSKNTAGMDNINLINAAAWDKKDTLIFSAKAGRNSKLSAEGRSVDAVDIDSIANGRTTFIKMDVEGSEMKALCGCEKTIKKYSPKLYVCAYHRNEDMFALPLKIWQMNDKYKIYFRHSVYIPAWESNFYCVAEED